MSQPEQEPGFAGNQSRTMSGALEREWREKRREGVFLLMSCTS